MKLSFFASTDIGKKRESNEDSFYAEPPVFAVADGLGGHKSGEIASSEALRIIAKRFEESIVENLDPLLVLQKSIEEANKKVFLLARQNEKLSGMGTTITTAYFHKNSVFVGHVGDSRAYLWDGSGLIQITKDHTYVQHLIDLGDIEAKEAYDHPMRSALTKAVGTSAEVIPDIIEIELTKEGMLLLCTDGLSSMLTDEEIADALKQEKTLKGKVLSLIKKANSKGGIDNITVVLVSFKL